MPSHTCKQKAHFRVWQEALRDKPLVDLEVPMLFVRGSKDPMCEESIFTKTLERMSSSNVEVCPSGHRRPTCALDQSTTLCSTGSH